MNTRRPPLFRKRKFEPIVIVTCVRWYCRFSLSLRDLEELMAERGLSVDHTTHLALDSGLQTAATAWAAIQGIEAAQMIRKGQVLGITRSNRRGQAWVFRSLLGVA